MPTPVFPNCLPTPNNLSCRLVNILNSRILVVIKSYGGMSSPWSRWSRLRLGCAHASLPWNLYECKILVELQVLFILSLFIKLFLPKPIPHR